MLCWMNGKAINGRCYRLRKIFMQTYVTHLAALATIEQKNGRAYQAMACQLYRLASYVKIVIVMVMY